MIYFGTRLSENISRREPEGYLICLNVPVARTGMQEYLPSELGMDGPDDRMIPVQRTEEEVLSPECMASFEGMPVTDDHPREAEGVNAENSRYLQKGHAHNIRRGTGEEKDLLLADLIITDPQLIEEILGGKREISCGYNYRLSEEDGFFYQREIRGNHVAVVDAGRAGPRVSIKDQDPIKERSKLMSKPMNKRNQCFAKMMTRMARDGETEALAELIGEILEEETVVLPEEPAMPEEPVVVEAPEDQPVIVDCGPEILAALNRIIELLSGGSGTDCGNPDRQADEEPRETAEETIEETGEAIETLAEAVAEAAAEVLGFTGEAAEGDILDPEDPVDELVAELLEEGTAESSVLEPEEDEEPMEVPDPRAADALRAKLAVHRPKLRELNPQERKAFNTDVAARMKKLYRSGGKDRKPNAYAALRQAVARERDEKELGRKIMEARNANLKK